MSRPLHNKQVGSVMVEFAGSLVLLLIIVFGTTEIGRAIYQLNTLTKSTEAGVRYMSRVVGALTFDPNGTSVDKQCAINTGVWLVAVEHAKNIVLYGTEAAGTTTRLPNMEVTSITVIPRIDPTLNSGGACVIKIGAKATFASIFGNNKPFPSFNGNDVSDGLVFTTNAEERYMGN